MNLNHLHLHVADTERAAAFYERFFGLRRSVVHGDILFLRDDAGLDLALAPGAPDTMPPWFHFGFRLAEKAAVGELFQRLKAEAGRITTDLTDDEDFAVFRCADPDGHLIEVYWEPDRS